MPGIKEDNLVDIEIVEDMSNTEESGTMKWAVSSNSTLVTSLPMAG